jgi:hypothetical protein
MLRKVLRAFLTLGSVRLCVAAVLSVPLFALKASAGFNTAGSYAVGIPGNEDQRIDRTYRSAGARHPAGRGGDESPHALYDGVERRPTTGIAGISGIGGIR